MHPTPVVEKDVLLKENRGYRFNLGMRGPEGLPENNGLPSQLRYL